MTVGWKKYTHHALLSQTIVSLGLSGLSLLLLVLVLLSVPGPIKGLYWFSVPAESSGKGALTAGVLGWCDTDTSNCTYAPLSDNPYLSTLINTGEALTVRIMLPLACYWAIVVICFWVLLTVTAPIGYAIHDLDSITRHLYFAICEACVLCVTLFGNVLCWLAFGLGRQAYLSAKLGGRAVHSGRAMETTAVAALMSLFALFAAVWGLHLRLARAQAQWKDEAVMVRRRSMAMLGLQRNGGTLSVDIEDSLHANSNYATNGIANANANADGIVKASGIGHGALSDEVQKRQSVYDDKYERSDRRSRLGMQSEKNDSTRWSDAPSYSARRSSTIDRLKDADFTGSNATNNANININANANLKVDGDGDGARTLDDEEERLDAELATARRNSAIHQEMMIRRASTLSPGDTPYAAGERAQVAL